MGKYEVSSTCGKNIYKSYEEALRVAEYQNRQNGAKLKIYECYLCSGWHLTENDPEKKVREQRDRELRKKGSLLGGKHRKRRQKKR